MRRKFKINYDKRITMARQLCKQREQSTKNYLMQ